jgi:DNA-binding transcriptional LysR family regulator
MLDWDDLKVFLAVSRSGTTLGAARDLGVNQTTVSRRVQTLEHALGLTLFVRRNTGYALTEHGRALTAAAERAAAAVAALEGEAERLRPADGRGAPHHGAGIGLRAADRADRGRLPQAEPGRARRTGVEREVPGPEGGEVDVAFRATGRPLPESLVAQRLPSFGWTVYCSEGYRAEHGCPTTPEALKDHAAVVYDKALAAAPQGRWFAARIDPTRVVARTNTVLNMRGLLEAGIGVGLLPCVEADFGPGLRRCFEPPDEIAAPWWLVMTPEVARTPLARRFADFAAARLRAQRRLLQGRAGVILDAGRVMTSEA